MTQSIEEAFAALRVQDLEMSLLRAQQQFRNVMAHARCYLCGEYIDDQCWHLGEVDEAQEIVHTQCFDEAAEAEARKSTENSYLYTLLPFEEIKGPVSYERGVGLPEGEAARSTETQGTARESAGVYPSKDQGPRDNAGRHLHLRYPNDDEGARNDLDARSGGPVEVCVPTGVDKPTQRVRPALKTVVQFEVATDMRPPEVREAQSLLKISRYIKGYENARENG